MISIRHSNKRKIHFLLLGLVFITCIWTRFAFLEQRGFIGADEYAQYEVLTKNFKQHSLQGRARASLWERPTCFFLRYPAILVFGHSVSVLLYFSAIMGLFTVVILYFIGERYIGRNGGLFAAAFMSTIYTIVFYSRHLKCITIALFFCSIVIWFLFKAKENPTNSNYIFCGLALGAAVTSHPNTYIFALVTLLLMAISTIINMLNFSLWRDRIATAARAWLCPLGMFLPMIAGEMILRAIKLIPFWDIDNIGIFRPMLTALSTPLRKGSIGFYLKTIEINGPFFLWATILFGLWVCISFSRLKKYGFYLLALFWGPILIYGLSSSIPTTYRNVVSSLLPACLICGAGLSSIVKWVESKRLGSWKSALFPALLIAVLVYGLSDSITCLRNVSAAQQIHDYIQVDRASMTRPNRSVYYWQNYYFRDRSLSCDTWSDVFRNYLSRRAEYLVQLIPYSTGAKELVDPKYTPTRVFRHLKASKNEISYGLFDLNAERHIFQEKFGFKRISKVEVSSPVILRCFDASMLAITFAASSLRFKLEPPEGANLLLINGRLSLHKTGDLLTVALGDYTNPYKFNLEMYQAKDPKTSIHTVWTLTEPIPESIFLSLIFTNNTKKVAKRKMEINDFEISFYHLPSQYINLAEECLLVITNEEKKKEYEGVLRRFASDFVPASPVVSNGDFSVEGESHLPLGWHRLRSSNIQLIANKGGKSNNIIKIICDPTNSWHHLVQKIPPQRFKPNTRYRLRFCARTNLKTKGQVFIRVRLSSKPLRRNILLSKKFWRPWWTWYEIKFTTLPDSKSMNLYLGNGKFNKPGGEVYFREITIAEIDNDV